MGRECKLDWWVRSPGVVGWWEVWGEGLMGKRIVGGQGRGRGDKR